MTRRQSRILIAALCIAALIWGLGAFVAQAVTVTGGGP